MITYKSYMIPNSYWRYTYLRYTMSLHNSNLFLKFELYMNFRIFTHAHAIYINRRYRRLIRTWPVFIPGHMTIGSLWLGLARNIDQNPWCSFSVPTLLMTHLRITMRNYKVVSGALRDEWKWIKMNYLVLIKIFIEKYTFIFINIHASDLIRNIKLISHMTRICCIVNRCVTVKNNACSIILIVCIHQYRTFFSKLPFWVDSGPFRLNQAGSILETHFFT